ncbi:hypothetical protein Y032_0028g1816 [Ancylostoma ceylanicum]|uniref:Uncharacterized protein n=1 Tax=Ancylostoma ceylanicum TaxID=53326 RepID=A0A016USE9_9BILA|nr:hypothetical protein Y032_0028g1816 [Ancylostoma ceylanicum]
MFAMPSREIGATFSCHGKACLTTIALRDNSNLSIFAHTTLGSAVPVMKMWQLSRAMASRTHRAHAMPGRRDAPNSTGETEVTTV